MIYMPILVICLFPVNKVSGQAPGGGIDGSVRGRVAESISGNPMEYVNIAVFSQAADELVTGGVSAPDGSFRIGDIPGGTYRLRFSFMGFQTLTIEDVRITRQEHELNLGTVILQPGAEMMDAVTVTAEREVLMFNLDKRVFAVGSDLTATGGSAIEILEAIPSVSVDFDGKVSLRGSQQVNILVDGRPSHFVSLDQVPATMIDRVEVITNPSARYDPDGTSGIINIIMKRQRQYGTNGMLSLNAGTGNKANGSVHINQRIDRLNLFSNYDFRLQHMTGLNLNDQDRINSQGDTLAFIRQKEDFYRRGVFNNLRLGADYFIGENRTLSATAAYNLRDTRPRNYSQVGLYIPHYQDVATSMERHFEGFGQEYVLSYTNDFDRNGRKLLADIYYAATRGETLRDIVVEPVGGALKETKYDQSLTPGRMLSFQTDYIHPLGTNSRLETGVKSVYRHVEDDFGFYDLDPSTGLFEPNPTFSNYFLYTEFVHSLYGIYAGAVGNLQLQAGVRAEQHDVRSEQRTTEEENDRTIRNLFPSFHLKYLPEGSHSFLRQLFQAGEPSVHVHAEPVCELQRPDEHQLRQSAAEARIH
jgi:outer membrane receptor protein involved in Fe transport